MFPASSVSGHYSCLVVALAKDQLEDYSARKQQPIAESEKWLAPYLNY